MTTHTETLAEQNARMLGEALLREQTLVAERDALLNNTESRIRLEVNAALNAVYVDTGNRRDVQDAAYAYLTKRFGSIVEAK